MPGEVDRSLVEVLLAVCNFGIDWITVMDAYHSIFVCAFLYVYKIAQQVFEMMRAVEKCEINAVWEKFPEAMPFEKLIGFQLEKMGFTALANWVPFQLEFRIDCDGRAFR